MAPKRPARDEARSARRSSSTAPPPSRRVTMWLAVSAIAILAPLIVLHNAGIRLGQGSFAYRYSPLYGFRVVRAFPAALLAIAAAGVIWHLCNRPQRRAVGVSLLAVVVALLIAWTWWAPPQPVLQHTFNFISPSQDGAFVLETRGEWTARGYLRNFDRHIQQPQEKFKGTRVISNPPGMTIVAMAAEQVFPPNPADPPWIDRFALSAPPGLLRTTAWPNALRVAFAALLMWAASAIFAYLLGREFLSTAGAAVFALIVMFNPSGVLFSPGKDPAQLLTINAMLWAGIVAWRRGSVALSAISGALLLIGSLMGLIHIWVALAAFAAVAWHTWRTDASAMPLVLRTLIPAVGGFLLLALAFYIAIGWNPLATLLAVQRRWSAVQPTIAVNRTMWLFIGLPIFLLFTSPAFWTVIGLNVRKIRHGDGFGRRLLLCTFGAMAATYVLGIPYELPRLWIAFLPPLALGAMIDLPLFHAEGSPRRVWRPLAMIVVVQICFTALHWTMFDVRESEYRLTTERLWN